MLKTVPTPPVSGRNRFYISNREPLLTNPLVKLPVGSIHPKGWLRRQLVLMAEGMIGHLPETSQWCQFKGNAWASAVGEGEFGWEEVPYWLRGFGDLGYVLGDQRIVAETKTWIEGVLSSQEPDGYFGPCVNKVNNDLWPNMLMLDVLRSFYEATGDSRVIPFVTKYFQWQHGMDKESLLPGSWQKVRGGDNLHSIYWLYNHTGEKWLLELATAIHERTADWVNGVPSWHGVNICESFREPAQFYQQSHDLAHLRATERDFEEVMDTYGQVPGGMFGADENARLGFVDPRQGAETCSIVEFMRSDEIMLSITGSPIYADRCENIALNSLPASMTPDLKALHYLTAPNMIQLDRGDKSPLLQNSGSQLSYETMLSNDPRLYRCCMHNAGTGWPYYAEHLWMATQNNGLAAVLYAPSEVEARVADGTAVKIVEVTEYPFDEVVSFTVLTAKRLTFPLLLRVPGWCKDPHLSINDHAEVVRLEPPKYLLIEREWNDGDRVQLALPMGIHLTAWPKNRNSVSVRRGPLAFSLKIEEKWNRCGGPDRWPSYEVYPVSPWNYGLLVDSRDPGKAFSVVR
ncbi:MAG TPA: beta-L-arabinofuranosidase domain-containing protein, partial [Thermoproteota archaeon]|nr:beta-L-arabinofuranosidase domain-containing protein [Thermoproteota archaeon]